jgi:hypothetical protein
LLSVWYFSPKWSIPSLLDISSFCTKDIELLLKSINNNTQVILIDYDNDNFDILKELITKLELNNITNIGLIREEYFNTYYKLFDNQEPFILQDIYHLDPNLDSWQPFISFLNIIKNNYNYFLQDIIGYGVLLRRVLRSSKSGRKWHVQVVRM